MNREMKFRAWDSEFGSFVEPDQYFIQFDGSAWFNNCDYTGDEMMDQSEKLTIEQCTTRKDSNGDDIYEGDILKYGSHHYICEWVDKRYDPCFSMRSLGRWSRYRETPFSLMEIIGNIHENPELMEEL